MTEQSFHEIQLSGKQLLFLFMCAVILAAVIFLFGVSVGRDVRGGAVQNAQAAPAATDTAAPVSSAPAPASGQPEVSYLQALPARSASAGQTAPQPAPPAEPPPVVSEPQGEAPAPAAAAPAATTSPKATPPPPDDFSLQAGAFSTESAATNLVNVLKGKGYPAALVTLPENTPVRYRVQVGPYHTRVDAQHAQTRLQKDGYKAILKR
jgi:cell division septation protein DedD